MAKSRTLLMLVFMAVGLAAISGCATWQEPDGRNSGSNPPPNYGGGAGGGGHHH